MPNVNTHCAISKQRTGKEFRDLHEWIDEPQKFFGMNHRIERHTLNDTYLKYVEDNWGKKGVVEWLFHIAIDNMETANKFAVDEYQQSYKEIVFVFDNKELKECAFTRQNLRDSNSKITTTYTKENE